MEENIEELIKQRDELQLQEEQLQEEQLQEEQLQEEQLQEEPLDEIEQNKILKEIKDRVDESINFFKRDNEQQKNDRELFSLTSVWNSINKELASSKIQVNVNPIKVYLKSIINQFYSNPYQPRIVSKTNNPFAHTVQKEIDEIFSSSNSSFVFKESLQDAVISGRGYTYLETDNDKIKLKYSYTPSSVLPDPNAKDITLKDANYVILVNQISKQQAQSLFPDIPSFDHISRTSLYSIPNLPLSSNDVNVLTYFVKDDPDVHCYKVIGDTIVYSTTFNKLSSIPVVSILGEEYFEDTNQTRHYKGIIRDVADIIRIINYCYSQISERLVSPSNPFTYISKEAIENLTTDYSDGAKFNFPYRRYNALLDGIKLDEPTYVTPKVDCQDIITILTNSLQALSQMLGIPQQGLGFDTSVKQTATEVLSNNQSIANNVSDFFSNLRLSFTQTTNTIVEIICESYDYDSSDLVVHLESGPEQTLAKEKLRQQLLSFSQLVSEQVKPLIMAEVVKTLDIPNADVISNAIILTLPEEIRPTNISNVINVQTQNQNLNKTNQQLQQTNQQLQQQLQQLQSIVNSEQIQNNAQLRITQINNEAALRQRLIEVEQSDKELNAKMQLEYAKLDETKKKDYYSLMEEQKKTQLENRNELLKEIAEAHKQYIETQKQRKELIDKVELIPIQPQQN